MKSPGSVARELSFKSLETFGLRFGSEALTMASGIIVARTLGPSAKGTLAYAGLVLALLTAISTGQSMAISWQYGRLKIASHTVYSAMLRFFALLVLPLSAVLAAIGAFRHDGAFVSAAIVFPFVYYAQTSLGFFMADGRVRWANLQGIIAPGTLLIFVAVATLVFRAQVSTILILWIFSWVIVAVCSSRLNREYRERSATPEGSAIWAAFRQQFGFGLKSALNQLVQTLNFQVDLLIVLFYLGTSSVGIYSLAVATGQAMWHLSRPLAVSALGRVVSKSERESAELTAACLRHSLFVVGIGCTILFFVGPALIVLVYGSRFAAAGPALRWILPGIVAYCSLPFLSQFFALQLGRPIIPTIAGGISTAICAIITTLLIPTLGIVAGSIGTSVSYVASFIFMLILFQRSTQLPTMSALVLTRSDFQHYVALARNLASGAMTLLRLKAA